jgi:hypothetical protein
MRKRQLEREEEEKNAFSPLKAYQRWCEPINSKQCDRNELQSRSTIGSKDVMKRSISHNLVKSSAPTWKMGERNSRAVAKAHSTISPGPKYMLTEAHNHLTKCSAPASSMHKKLEHGGLLEAVGGGKNSRSNPDAIGMDLTNWTNSNQLDRGAAAARHTGNGKSFGVKHAHLNPKFNENPSPNEYSAATDSFKKSTIPSTQPKTMGMSFADLMQEDDLDRSPGPAQYSPSKARSKLAFKENPHYSMAERLKVAGPIGGDWPSPDHYGVPPQRFNSKNQKAPSHSFGYHKQGKTIIHTAGAAGTTKKKKEPPTSS